MRYLAFPLAMLICGLLGWGIMRVGFAQELAGFTAAQAGQGGVTYSQNCSRCHGESLEGSNSGPALSGQTFVSQWRSRAVGELFREISQTMPPSSPGSHDESLLHLGQ